MKGSAPIVGGGIGGLALASALHASYWDVTLFERGAGAFRRRYRARHVAVGAGRARRDRRRRAGASARHATGVGGVLRANGSRIGVLNGERLVRRTGDPVYPAVATGAARPAARAGAGAV